MRLDTFDRDAILGQLIDEYGGSHSEWVFAGKFENLAVAIESVIARHVRQAQAGRLSESALAPRAMSTIPGNSIGPSIYDPPVETQAHPHLHAVRNPEAEKTVAKGVWRR